jgi:hypothetical protein
MVILPPLPIRRDAARGASARVRRAVALTVMALMTVVLVAGCAKPRAEGLMAGPPLGVPPPPPRVLAPVELEAVSATAGVPPAGPPELAPGNGVAASSEAAGPATPRSTPPPPPPPAEPPAADTAASEPPRELRVVPSAEDAAAERRVRTVIEAANRDLSRVDTGRLSANAADHYAQARRHLEMADGAIRDRNLTYALYLAQAGATVASQLLASVGGR